MRNIAGMNLVHIIGAVILCMVVSVGFADPDCENCSPTIHTVDRTESLFNAACNTLDSNKPFLVVTYDCRKQECDDELYYWKREPLSESSNFPAGCGATTWTSTCPDGTCHPSLEL